MAEKKNNGANEEAKATNNDPKKEKDTRSLKEKFTDWKDNFVEEHPVATRRLKKAKDLAEGAAIGGLAVFGTLAYMGYKKDGDSSNEIPEGIDLPDDENK